MLASPLLFAENHHVEDDKDFNEAITKSPAQKE